MRVRAATVMVAALTFFVQALACKQNCMLGVQKIRRYGRYNQVGGNAFFQKDLGLHCCLLGI